MKYDTFKADVCVGGQRADTPEVSKVEVGGLYKSTVNQDGKELLIGFLLFEKGRKIVEVRFGRYGVDEEGKKVRLKKANRLVSRALPSPKSISQGNAAAAQQA
jgi:hypothetical protein